MEMSEQDQVMVEAEDAVFQTFGHTFQSPSVAGERPINDVTFQRQTTDDVKEFETLNVEHTTTPIAPFTQEVRMHSLTRPQQNRLTRLLNDTILKANPEAIERAMMYQDSIQNSDYRAFWSQIVTRLFTQVFYSIALPRQILDSFIAEGRFVIIEQQKSHSRSKTQVILQKISSYSICGRNSNNEIEEDTVLVCIDELVSTANELIKWAESNHHWVMTHQHFKSSIIAMLSSQLGGTQIWQRKSIYKLLKRYLISNSQFDRYDQECISLVKIQQPLQLNAPCKFEEADIAFFILKDDVRSFRATCTQTNAIKGKLQTMLRLFQWRPNGQDQTPIIVKLAVVIKLVAQETRFLDEVVAAMNQVVEFMKIHQFLSALKLVNRIKPAVISDHKKIQDLHALILPNREELSAQTKLIIASYGIAVTRAEFESLSQMYQ